MKNFLKVVLIMTLLSVAVFAFAEREISGTVTSNTLYIPGATAEMEFTLDFSSPDVEWVAFLELTFPEGMTPTGTPASIVGGTNELQFNQISGQVASWGAGFGDTSMGYLSGTNSPFTFSLEVEIDAGVSGDQMVAYYAAGDDYGSEPHEFSGDCVVSPALDNDLVAVAVAGNPTPTVGVGENYQVSVYNQGQNAAAAFDVELFEGEGNSVGVVNATDLAGGEMGVYDFTFTPENAGATVLYATVDWADDENDSNNMTDEITVDVQASGTAVVTIGEGTDLGYYLPANYFYKNSVSQTIYYADELQIGGVLTAIDYFYNFAEIPVVSDLNVWVGETTQTDLSGGMIPSTELTQVYSGPFEFVEGEGSIHVTFDAPYAYGGGNLVVLVQRPMDTEYYSSSDKFYYSTDAVNTARSYYKYSDVTEYDPANPPTDGTATGDYPNAAFYFITEGMGSLAGNVTSDGAPLADVAVVIDGTSAMTYTNADGDYSFPYVMEGEVNLTASKFGFYDATASGTVVEDETTTVDMTMDPLPTVMVSGNVFGSDYPDVGIEAATVMLSGYEEYEGMTDADGHFEIAGVYAGHTYDVTINADGYDAYSGTVEVGDVDVVMDDVTLLEVVSPASNVVATPNAEYTSVDVTWEEPTGSVETEFRYDDGVVTGQLGFGANPSAVFGGAYAYDASITEITWYLTSNAVHTEAVLYIFGLDASGMPDDGQLLHESAVQPNVDDAWNTYTLETPVEAPNGFFVGVCTPGIFTAIGTDDGLEEPYVFQEGTQWGIADWTAGTNEWLDPGTAGFPYNFSIRAMGANNGPVALDRTAKNGADHKITGLNGSQLRTSVDTGAPVYNTVSTNRNDRMVESYDVYRFEIADLENPENWDELATGLTDLAYTDDDFVNVDAGEYQYAVVAMFTNDVAAPAAFSNVIQSGVMGTVTFDVTTNDGESAEGAAITFTAADGDPEHVYEATVGADGTAMIEDVWFETYTLEISLGGYDAYVENNILFEEDGTIEAELAETLSAVVGLDATVDEDTVTLTWADPSAGGDEMTEGFEDGTLPTDWMTLDVDGDGYTWINTIADGFGFEAHTGEGAMTSASYMNDVGALFPDNYLITPQIALGGSSQLTFWVAAQDAAWAAEYYEVKVSTSGTAAGDFADVVFSETLADDTWHEVVVDLSAYAGQQAYIAWNHTDVTDMFYMKLDDVEISNASRVNRALESYTVKRNGEVVATELTEATYVDTEVPEGEHTYSVAAVYTTGTSEYTDIDVVVDLSNADDITPIVTALKGNYPNPFNPTTTISYDLATEGRVNISIYNVKGQLVKTLVNEHQEAASHTAVWDGRDSGNKNVATGVYFYRMSTPSYDKTNKMILMK